MLRILLTAAIALPLVAQSPVPVPKVTGPVPVTATSKIFGAAAANLTPVDLAKFGYVEEEFLISGTANVYDWLPNGSLEVKGANNPYGTRIVLRRPADPAKFRGTVVVELPNIARRYDWPMMWGFLHDYVVEQGAVWVEIGMPQSVASMKKFDARYSSMTFDNTTKVCPGEIEDGLRYDVISQVAAALKSKQAGMPLAALNVQRVFLSTQDTGMVTYINAFHQAARLDGGKPTYDGYLIKVLNAPGLINSCAKALAQNDPRRMLKAVDVPTITVVAQGEVEGMAWSRKPDSDEAVGRHRRYEVAMASHIDKNAYAGMPSFAEQNAIGSAQGTADWPFNARCEPEIQFQEEPLLSYMFEMALGQLDRWSRGGGYNPPHAPLMDLDAKGKLVLDEFGIGKGGIRSPYSDVPTARYLTASGGPGNCREFGSTHPLTYKQMDQRYGSAAKYADKVDASIKDMVKGGWLLDADAERMRRLLLQ